MSATQADAPQPKQMQACQVDALADGQERRVSDLAEEAHAALVLVLAGEGVELLGRDADDVGGVQVSEVLAVAGQLAARQPQGASKALLPVSRPLLWRGYPPL